MNNGGREKKPSGVDKSSQWARPSNSLPQGRLIERNIDALIEMRDAEERKKGWQDRFADLLTGFSGSMTFIYIHVVCFAFWIVYNMGWLGRTPFDPFPFSLLTLIVSLEAIFLATFVLISQNRAGAMANRRSDLDLQVNLLAEREATHLLNLVDAIADRLGIAVDKASIHELEEEVEPKEVLDKLSAREAQPQEK